jgi:hypothetical protein
MRDRNFCMRPRGNGLIGDVALFVAWSSGMRRWRNVTANRAASGGLKEYVVPGPRVSGMHQ